MLEPGKRATVPSYAWAASALPKRLDGHSHYSPTIAYSHLYDFFDLHLVIGETIFQIRWSNQINALFGFVETEMIRRGLRGILFQQIKIHLSSLVIPSSLHSVTEITEEGIKGTDGVWE